MTLVTIAPAGNDAPADVRLDGKTDMAILAKYWTVAGARVHMLAGRINLNGGSSGDPSGGGYLRPGKGATITGEAGTVLEARNSIVRITIDKPGVTLKQLAFEGRAHLQWFDTGSNFLGEDLTVDQDSEFGDYDDWKAFAEQQPSYAKPGTFYDLKKNCTAAFLFYAKKGTTLRGVTLRRCHAVRSYHHGFSMHVYSYQEGATFQDFLFENCKAISCGSGLLSPRDWSTGFNTADTGNLKNIWLTDCKAVDCYQSGLHCDGNWSGHSQTVENLVYERCAAVDCGQRCAANEVERFCCGFYGQSARYIDCHTTNCANAGFGVKNEKANSLVIAGCTDTGSAYGLICEYAAPGAVIEFTSRKAKVRAFQGQVTAGGTLDLTIIDGPPVAVTFGRTERIDYLQCPGHAAQVRDKYDRLGYTIQGSAITIRAAERPTVEVWKTSKLNGQIVYVPTDGTPEPEPEVEVPPVILPPKPEPFILSEDGALKCVLEDGRVLMQVGGFMHPDAAAEFPHGTIWRRVVE